MKKGRIIIAGMVICSLLGGGCGKTAADQDDTAITAVSDQQEETKAESLPEEEPVIADEENEEEDPSLSGDPEPRMNVKTAPGTPYEDAYVTVSCDGAAADEDGSIRLALQVTSKYAEPAVCYSNFVSVNGWDMTADKWFYEEIGAEGALTLEIALSADELQEKQIQSVDRLQIIMTLGEAEDLSEIDRFGFTFYTTADGDKTDPVLAETEGLTPVSTDEEAEIYLTGAGNRQNAVALEGILVNHTQQYLTLTIPEVYVGGQMAAVSGDAVIFPDSAGRFALEFADNRANSDLLRNGGDVTFTLAARDFYTDDELWSKECSAALPDGFAERFSMSGADTGTAWMPYGMSSYSEGSAGKNPYDGGVAGIQFMDLLAEVPMTLFNQNEAISPAITAFYNADSYVLAIVDAAGTESSMFSAGPDSYGAYVASQISPGAEYTVRETFVAGESAVIVEIKDAETASGTLDFSIAAFYSNGVFYGFGAGVLDDACDQSAMFERLVGGIRKA